MKNFVLWVGRQFGKNNQIHQLKMLAAKHPICVLEIDMIYNRLLLVDQDSGFKGIPPKDRWEFLDKAFTVAAQTMRDPEETVRELWYASKEQHEEMTGFQHGQI